MTAELFKSRPRVVKAIQWKGKTNKSLVHAVKPIEGEVSLSGVCRICHGVSKGHGYTYVDNGVGGNSYAHVCPNDWVVQEEVNGVSFISIFRDEDFQKLYEPVCEAPGENHGNTNATDEGGD